MVPPVLHTFHFLPSSPLFRTRDPPFLVIERHTFTFAMALPRFFSLSGLPSMHYFVVIRFYLTALSIFIILAAVHPLQPPAEGLGMTLALLDHPRRLIDARHVVPRFADEHVIPALRSVNSDFNRPIPQYFFPCGAPDYYGRPPEAERRSAR